SQGGRGRRGISEGGAGFRRPLGSTWLEAGQSLGCKSAVAHHGGCRGSCRATPIPFLLSSVERRECPASGNITPQERAMSSLFSSVRSKPPASTPLSPFSGVSMAEIKHRSARTNGITMHLAEQGEGPLVVLCHGFPEFWYSWRHQLPALAAAGFH